MYCPRCEFEIKQDITECPICGGAVTEHPEEAPDSAAESEVTNPADSDLREASLSELILDAKQEIESLQDDPKPEVQPGADEFNLEELLNNGTSGDADHPPDASPAPEPAVPDEPPVLDDLLSLDDEAIVAPDSRTPDASVHDTQPEEQSTFSENELFFEESAVSPDRPEETSFIDEAYSDQETPHALDTLVIPTHGQETAGFESSGMPSQHAAGSSAGDRDAEPDDVLADDMNFMDIDETSTGGKAIADQTNPEKPIRPRSKKRLVFIALFGVLIIAGAYFLTDYILPDRAPVEPVTQPPALPEAVRIPDAPPKEEAPPAEPQPIPPAQPPKIVEAEPRPPAPPEEKPAVEPALIEPPDAPAEPEETLPDIPVIPKRETVVEDRPFSIHVASFRTQQTTLEETARLRELGFDAFHETVDLGERGIWHRVKVGRYASREDAAHTIQRIREKNPGIEPVVLRNR